MKYLLLLILIGFSGCGKNESYSVPCIGCDGQLVCAKPGYNPNDKLACPPTVPIQRQI